MADTSKVKLDPTMLGVVFISGAVGFGLGYYLMNENKPSSINPLGRNKNFGNPAQIKPGETKYYCRCWKSKRWPLCDGSHQELDDPSVGPLAVKGEKTA